MVVPVESTRPAGGDSRRAGVRCSERHVVDRAAALSAVDTAAPSSLGESVASVIGDAAAEES